MELTLKRVFFTETCTIGELSLDGEFICHILEDVDRGLNENSTLEDKIHGKTAIPYGRYEIIINFSNRFQRLLPLLLNVHLYVGIRMHPGNKAIDTDGCLLPGVWDGKSELITNSRVTFTRVFALLRKMWTKGKIFITITK